MPRSVFRAAAFATLVAGLALAHAPAEAAKRMGEPFRWTEQLAPGKTLRVKGINGSIRAQLASGSRVVVEAEKWGSGSDPDQVKIEVSRDADGLTVCARYPNLWGGLSSCRGAWGVLNNDVMVEFTLQVPAGVQAVLTTVNGGVSAERLRGPVRARTVNGSVRVETTGRADVKTVNGSIVARMRPEGRRDHEFASVNGSIRLEIPRDIDADVRARTVNGSISSDFPMTIRRRWVGRRLSGTLGRGGPDIEMVTVNGSISLRSM